MAYIDSHTNYRPFLDSLVDQAVIIQANGEILASNHSWQLFSDNNNGTPDSTDVGVNYLKVCKRSHLEDGQFSSKAYDGILSVIRKEVELFELEYPCHSKAEKRWFTLRATPIKNSESLILIMHIDITRRKLYELEREAILEAEQKERDLLSAGEELAKMGTWEWDIHTNKVKVSNNSLQMFGIGQKDYDGSIKGLMKYVHQRDKGKIYEQFERMVSNKKPESLEFRVSLPDDELRYIKGISKVYLDKEGEVTKLVGINQDITEEKVAEKQLFEAKELVEESEKRLSIASKSAKLGIWEWKVEENELIWNDRMYELYGRERGTDINNFNLWANGLHPNDKEKALKDLDNALKGLNDFDTYFRVVHPSGKVLYIKSNALVIRDDEGRPKRMIGINRDITEYKTKELELHKAKEGSEKRASELKESQKIAKIGSWYLNAFTNEVSWTEELYKMYGFDPNLPVPPYTEHMKLFTPDSWEILSRELAKTREKGIPYELELEMVKKDSSKGWMWVKGEAVFDKDKKIIGLRGIAQDITERKEAEERLQRQNEELQRTNHELDNFVYRVSHDLRAPIASSLGLIDLMSSASDVDGMKELLFMQKKSMLKLDGFIQDILDYSRNTRMELEASPIDLEELASETYTQLSYIKGAEKIDFSIELEGGNIIYSDKMRLSFIFNNLLSNAIRFYDSNKELSYIKLKAAVDVNNVAVSLLDNGIGIEEKHMDRIFDMFYRGTNQRNGSGLGLYIVKESVKKLGGEIKVESNHKVGTTINLTLPNMKLA